MLLPFAYWITDHVKNLHYTLSSHLSIKERQKRHYVSASLPGERQFHARAFAAA